ncbi:hypothetical protein BT69DRAFT_1317476 [Atractiella rhizophila]|nr:hypothetical protein BT69DRAFT_1317476 [Atractiella rhizophila]
MPFHNLKQQVSPKGVEVVEKKEVRPQDLTRFQFIYAYGLMSSLFFAWGFAYGLLDSLNKHFQSVFGISKTQSTFMQVAYFGAYFLWAPWAAGPLIASREIYKGKNSTDLGNVQWVYLGVGCFGILLLVLFYFATLPEIDERNLLDTLANQEDVKPIHKQKHTIFGALAQFSYVGSQVAVASFAVNLFADTPSIAYAPDKASLYYSYCQMVFALGRFMGTGLLYYVDPAHALTAYALACCCFTIGVTQATGNGIVACTFLLFYFESICWTTIYALAISRLGRLTKVGGSFVVAGVGGGALFAPLQGVLADATYTQKSYWVAFTGFVLTFFYGVGMSVDKYRRRNIDPRTGLRKDHVLKEDPFRLEDGEEKKRSEDENIDDLDEKRKSDL